MEERKLPIPPTRELDPAFEEKYSAAFFPIHEQVTTIKHLIVNAPREEACLGLFGPWGSGKSTLIRFLIEELEGMEEETFQPLPIYIDCWEYERHESLLVPLLLMLRAKSGKNRVDLKKIAKVVSYSFVDLGLRKIGTSLEEVEKRLEDEDPWWTKQSDMPGDVPVEKIKGTFKEMAGAVFKTCSCDDENGRIVFFVDNLDRVSPDKAVNLLESVRNLMRIPAFYFVFAVDPDVIADFIQTRYNSRTINGHEYLKKCLDFSFHVKDLTVESRKDFLGFLRCYLDKSKIDTSLWVNVVLETRKLCNFRRLNNIVRRYQCYVNHPNSRRPAEALVGICLYEGWPEIYHAAIANLRGFKKKMQDIYKEEQTHTGSAPTFGLRFLDFLRSDEVKEMLVSDEFFECLTADIWNCGLPSAPAVYR